MLGRPADGYIMWANKWCSQCERKFFRYTWWDGFLIVTSYIFKKKILFYSFRPKKAVQSGEGCFTFVCPPQLKVFMPCHDMSCHVTSCHVMSSYIYRGESVEWLYRGTRPNCELYKQEFVLSTTCELIQPDYSSL